MNGQRGVGRSAVLRLTCTCTAVGMYVLVKSLASIPVGVGENMRICTGDERQSEDITLWMFPNSEVPRYYCTAPKHTHMHDRT